MSTGPERNPRGVRVWQRDSTGEIIPEREGGASPNDFFARTFSTIAAGLHASGATPKPNNVNKGIH